MFTLLFRYNKIFTEWIKTALHGVHYTGTWLTHRPHSSIAGIPNERDPLLTGHNHNITSHPYHQEKRGYSILNPQNRPARHSNAPSTCTQPTFTTHIPFLSSQPLHPYTSSAKAKPLHPCTNDPSSQPPPTYLPIYVRHVSVHQPQPQPHSCEGRHRQTNRQSSSTRQCIIRPINPLSRKKRRG